VSKKAQAGGGAADDLQRWKNHLLLMPAPLFFNVIRNYLGEVSSPFDKHDLIQDLIDFLKRRETRRRIAAFIGVQERLILSGIAALGRPTLDMLYLLLAQDFGYLDMNEKLLNMECRLLTYRSENGGEPRVAVNPVLAGRLGDEAFGPENLVRLEPVKQPTVAVPWLQDSLLLAFLSHLLDEAPLFKAGGQWRRKGLEGVTGLFPGLADERGERLRLLVAVLRRLGLVERTGAVLKIEWAAWKSLAEMTRRARLLLLWSTAAFPSDWDPARFLALTGSFLGSVPPGRGVSRDHAARLLMVETIRCGTPFPTKTDIDRFLGSLEELLLLAPCGDDLVAPNPWLQGVAAGEKPGGLVTQPNYEISMPREMDLGAGLPVAVAARIRRFDQVASFELTRASFHRWLNRGGTAAGLLARLGELSNAAVPQNVGFSLETWEREYRKLEIFDGIVMVADEDREYLLEHSRLLKDFIHRKLAPGIYLLSRGEMEQWKAALHRAGLEHVPEVKVAGSEREEPEADALFPVGAELRLQTLDIEGGGKGGRSVETGEAAQLEADLLEALDRKAGSLDEWDREEIRGRIAERLILFKRQLAPLRRKSERMEAKGLDYAGKVRVIERALHERGLLEVIHRGESGAPQRITLEPEELEKRGSGLVLRARRIPEGREMEIRVSKIGLVRRLRQNLR